MLKKVFNYLGVPVTIAIILSLLLAGAVYAVTTYVSWEGEARVTVEDCLTVSKFGGVGDYTADSDGNHGIWTVSVKPGEIKELVLQVANSSSAPVPINGVIAQDAGTPYVGLTGSVDEVPGSVPGNGNSYVTFRLTASSSAAPTLDVPVKFLLSIER